jgi:hypothetical protein
MAAILTGRKRHALAMTTRHSGIIGTRYRAAGEKLFVDDAGQRPHLVDPQTGEAVAVELFVAALQVRAAPPTAVAYTRRRR